MRNCPCLLRSNYHRPDEGVAHARFIPGDHTRPVAPPGDPHDPCLRRRPGPAARPAPVRRRRLMPTTVIVLQGYPRLSETFIAHEIHQLERLGLALRLAADLAEQLAIAQPKALALDRIADTESVFTIRETAKTIKIKERELTALLLKRKWAYRDSRKVMQPYAETIARGYVIAVMTAPITGGDGQDRVFSQLRITAKGVTRLGYLVAKKVVA